MKNKYQAALFDETKKAKASRLSFGEELAALGEKDSRIVALDADLSKSTRTDLFAAKFPDRFFEMGIAEANMIGTAAGLANAGKVPYAASFGCFLTGRYDQIRMSISFSGTNVRLVGTHAGVGIGEDGHSQMALEDLTLMRSLPNMTVFQPADDEDTRNFMQWSVKHEGPCYLRLTRQNLPSLKRMTKQNFAPGRWEVLNALKPGMRVVMIGTGALVGSCVEAADHLSEHWTGEEFGVVNANWIHPIDESTLAEIVAKKPAMIVTAEDHYTVGGLGGAVAEVLSKWGNTPPLLRIGVEGFGQSGTPEDNYRHYGLTGESVAQKIIRTFDSVAKR